jgi:hypothetical protein
MDSSVVGFVAEFAKYQNGYHRASKPQTSTPIQQPWIKIGSKKQT